MHGSLQFPDTAQLEAAAQFGACVPCHQCAGRRNTDCPSCLGSGFLRPCAACLGRGRRFHHLCVICNGLLFTAGDPPSAREDDPPFGHTAYAVGRPQTAPPAA
ncbi:MAG TPA: hypothetical protein VGG42_18825 [Acidobacteriaceae bacterium]|jgi:hypothetical protein